MSFSSGGFSHVFTEERRCVVKTLSGIKYRAVFRALWSVPMRVKERESFSTVESDRTGTLSAPRTESPSTLKEEFTAYSN